MNVNLNVDANVNNCKYKCNYIYIMNNKVKTYCIQMKEISHTAGGKALSSILFVYWSEVPKGLPLQTPLNSTLVHCALLGADTFH